MVAVLQPRPRRHVAAAWACVCLLALLAAPHAVSAQDKTMANDLHALLGLKGALGHSRALRTWTGNDPCSGQYKYRGVECGTLDPPLVNSRGVQEKYYIKGLALPSQKLTGHINKFIGSFYRLESLDLSENSLAGAIPDELQSLTSLTLLDLSLNKFNGTLSPKLRFLAGIVSFDVSNNNLTGIIPRDLGAWVRSPIERLLLNNNRIYGRIPRPFSLLKTLKTLNLANNEISLSLPFQLSTLTNLESLHLEKNYIAGHIPPQWSAMAKLRTLKVSRNQLTGLIPDTFSALSNLVSLMANNNNLTGPVPTGLTTLPYLTVLSLQTNNFTGTVGPAFSKYPVAFQGNPYLCVDFKNTGVRTCNCSGGVQATQQCNPTEPPAPCTCPAGAEPVEAAPAPGGGGGGGGLSGAAIALIVIVALLGALGLGAFFIWGFNTNFGRKKSGGWEYAGKIRSFPDVRTYRSQAYDPDEIDAYGIQAYDPTPKTIVEMNGGGGGMGGAAAVSAGKGSTAAAFARKFGRSLSSQLTMRRFSYDELQLATNNFSADNIIGTDGMQKTYSGVLPSGTYMAVKEVEGPVSDSVEAFAAAVEMFSFVRCPQLVEVLGFCAHDSTRLLVYELMPNGSLDLHLHVVEAGTPVLDWNTRMSIALQAAKGLAYLHSLSPQMVHQHLRATAVLLDDALHAKLSDYCLDSLRTSTNGASAPSNNTNVAVAAGTAAPELAWSPEPTARTDVYSFGVLLLEVITGRRPIDSARPPNEQSLIRWVKPRLSERSQVEGLVDSKLFGSYSSAALYQVALLASQCILSDPEARPGMAQAVEVLQNVQGLPVDSARSAAARGTSGSAPGRTGGAPEKDL